MARTPLRYWIYILLALACGAALRLWFLQAYPDLEGDTFIYGDIAKNWLVHGVYGLSSNGAIQPTLIRLPGYPLYLAVCFRLFGMEHYHAVVYLQILFDLATCLLVVDTVRRLASRRAAAIALFLTALCPFTANYAAMPLTEALSLFCVALGLYSLIRLAGSPPGRGCILWIVLLAASVSYAALLRPDGALLGVVLIPAVALYGRRGWGWPRALRIALVTALLAILPLIPWTIRNYRTFHLFQPLAPRYATDPGEFVATGFVQWVRTWCADLTSTSEIYWNVDTDPISVDNLPSRAFDSPRQYRETADILAAYNQKLTVTPALDARFAALAAERARAHPFRTYVELPLLRLADMWLRPRTENLWIEMRWWQYDRHHSETEFAAVYAGLNLLFVVAAFAGLIRRPPFAAAMLAFLLLRSALLATLEAPEPRYTLECFPVVLALAAIALGGWRRDDDLLRD